MSSKKYKFVRKVRKIKKYGWLKLKITVATSVVLSGVFLLLLIVTCIGNVTSAILASAVVQGDRVNLSVAAKIFLARFLRGSKL